MRRKLTPELRATEAPAAGLPARGDLARDVRHSLQRQPRQLPSRYFYDALGSCLFEAICGLPWYRITRAEQALLERHAPEIGLAVGTRCATFVELGCGSGEKLATLVRGIPTPRGAPLDLHLVDVSPAALALSERALAAVGHARVVPHRSTYESGLADAVRQRRSGPMLVLFLGSNIGNFDPDGAATFLTAIREMMRPGDGLLLGADLIKPEADLLRAYDDPLGVTASFNKNLLVRINRELAADFDLAAFTHRAVWNADAARIEMHLVSRRAQRVRVPGAGLQIDFAKGEAIWTESSYKYEEQQLAPMLRPHGFRARRQWVHQEARFALTLASAD